MRTGPATPSSRNRRAKDFGRTEGRDRLPCRGSRPPRRGGRRRRAHPKASSRRIGAPDHALVGQQVDEQQRHRADDGGTGAQLEGQRDQTPRVFTERRTRPCDVSGDSWVPPPIMCPLPSLRLSQRPRLCRSPGRRRVRGSPSRPSTGSGHPLSPWCNPWSSARDRADHHRHGPGEPDRGRHRGQSRAGAAAAGGGRASGADLVVFPELMLVGYPPEDLVLKPAVVRACAPRPGASWRATPPTAGRRWWSGRPGATAARSTTRPSCCAAGPSPAASTSTSCPTTACSTRSACSQAGPIPGPVRLPSRPAGRPARASWSARTCGSRTWPRRLGESGAEILLVPNGSPFEHGKLDQRLQLARGAGHRDRPAAALCQPGRRPGRAGVRRRLVRARRATAGWWRRRRASSRR